MIRPISAVHYHLSYDESNPVMYRILPLNHILCHSSIEVFSETKPPDLGLSDDVSAVTIKLMRQFMDPVARMKCSYVTCSYGRHIDRLCGLAVE
ncbi:hypothetical protein DPMN_117689 [Dreissena polymorpha]|uniref:Uncharacterized protein n=1 Tax=Dreissena polymorpha TaxID=45954 RepID=A0A9D4GJG5_DREPO|nr:hypothetical protein DPMN_117689 [Dreissena polymorpha]